MKNLVVLFMGLISFSVMSQTDSTKKCSVTPYVSLGISIGNVAESSTFAESSYPSIEFGVCHKNLTLGVSGGTYSFSNYNKPWFELKTTASKEFGSVNVFGVYIVMFYLNN